MKKLRNVRALVCAILFLFPITKTTATYGDTLADQIHTQNDNESMPYKPLSIRTQSQDVHFKVQVAASPKQLAIGLMFRKNLPDRTGMLFNFFPARQAKMWMKNTVIPLDMLFIHRSGEIAWIEENTQPLSMDVKIAPVPVAAVLEIAGGAVAQYGIKVGDTVLHPLFSSSAENSFSMSPTGKISP